MLATQLAHGVQLVQASRIMVHMQEELLPLFPLQVVLFPQDRAAAAHLRGALQTDDCRRARGHSEFGVVLAGEKGIVNTGCTATVEKVLKKYPDGRMDLISIGPPAF